MTWSMIAISDLHGEYDRVATFLQSHGVISANREWQAEGLTLVIVGDLVDRGPQIFPLMQAVRRWQMQAPRTHSQVVWLAGNHEAMWLQGDWSYVPKKQRHDVLRTAPEWGEWLETLPVSFQWQDWMFIHGGWTSDVHWPDVLTETLDDHDDWALTGSSPLWTHATPCLKDIQDALGPHGIRHVVMGHVSKFFMLMDSQWLQTPGPLSVDDHWLVYVDPLWNNEELSANWGGLGVSSDGVPYALTTRHAIPLVSIEDPWESSTLTI